MNGNSEHGEHHPAASPSARSCSMKNQIGPGRTAAQAAQPTPPAKNSSALPNNSRSSRTGTDHPPLPRTPRLPPDRRISNRHQKHGLRSSQGRTRPLRPLPPAKYPSSGIRPINTFLAARKFSLAVVGEKEKVLSSGRNQGQPANANRVLTYPVSRFRLGAPEMVSDGFTPVSSRFRTVSDGFAL